MPETKYVNISALSGYEFEHLVAEIFRGLGYGVEELPLSGDEGRDLVARKEAELLVIECKNHSASIGRPVVQKLHSAFLTYPGATKGLVVAMGGFTEQAWDYTNKINAGKNIIHLMDFAALAEGAKDAGFVLYKKDNVPNVVYHVASRNAETFQQDFLHQIISRIRTHPRIISKECKFTSAAKLRRHFYFLEYSVNKTFSSQGGVIHVVHEARKIAITATNSRPMPPEEVNFWKGSAPRAKEVSFEKVQEISHSFSDSYPEMCRKSTMEEVSKRLSKTISYSGGNNQRYEKLCQVLCEDVQVSCRKTVAFVRKTQFQLGPQSYTLIVTDDASRPIQILDFGGLVADAQRAFLEGGALCNDCGELLSATSAIKCVCCKKRLCSAHFWKWPNYIGSAKGPYCADCYRGRARERAKVMIAFSSRSQLSKEYKLLLSASFFPGLAFILRGRPLLGAVMMGATLVGSYFSIWTLAAGVFTSCAGVYLWLRQSKVHYKNLGALEIYHPPWE